MKHLISSLLFVSLLSTALLAQQKGQCLCLEFPSGQKTSGKDSQNGKSKVGISIGGFGSHFVSVPVGTTSEGLSSAFEKSLKAKGFGVKRADKTTICIVSGPGGKPLTKGGGMGSTDSGITSLRSQLCPQAPQGVKARGANLPKAKKNAVASKSGKVQIDATVLKKVGGKIVQQHVQVQVPIQKGEKAADVDKKVRKALEKTGFHVQEVEMPSALDEKILVPSFGVDQMQDGSPLQGIGFGGQLPPDFYPLDLGAGRTPAFGTTNQGFGQGTLPFPTPFSGSYGEPSVGQPFPFFHAFPGLASLPGAFLLGTRPLELRIDALTPGFDLLVDPGQALFLLAPLDLAGRMNVQIPIPQKPGLRGLTLMTQGFVLEPKTPLRLRNSDRLVTTIR